MTWPSQAMKYLFLQTSSNNWRHVNVLWSHWTELNFTSSGLHPLHYVFIWVYAKHRDPHLMKYIHGLIAVPPHKSTVKTVNDFTVFYSSTSLDISPIFTPLMNARHPKTLIRGSTSIIHRDNIAHTGLISRSTVELHFTVFRIHSIQ